ncbi:deoxyuridine 5'-triphosphate nucleotidohydrolase-like [Asparagus officinalis]|uniref:deoxyuridine 5'-triphosphate nucleotidohydrolase-like n=1 Tax=Asparagus officinalis TaxID=4686 RepID=UPI00098E4329|nr:deoxyuridine 5'-triphosphate nucleotidohydrolase-like [Asparagus officinalis]
MQSLVAGRLPAINFPSFRPLKTLHLPLPNFSQVSSTLLPEKENVITHQQPERPSALSQAPQALPRHQWRRQRKQPERPSALSRHPSHVAKENPPLLKIKKLSENAILPSRASPLSAGYDLSSAVATKVPARGKALVPTDLSISIPEGTYARVAPRSGLAWKHSIDVGAGVIDADYRGPLGVILFNFSDVDFEVKAGDRIAQFIIERIMTPDVVEVEDLDSTARGAGGFGSTGV